MRPALIVGLGGTGSWAGAYLKRRLLTDHRYRLLADDTAAATTDAYNTVPFEVWIQAADVDKTHRPNVAGVTLDRTEEVPLAAGVGDALKHIKGDDAQRAFPTIEAWLPRDEAKQLELGDATDFMSTGAGQIRQFGRIAFFLDILGKKELLNRLASSVGRLTTATGEDELTIFVLSSLAGGAGAGFLVDTLAFLQDERRKLAGDVSLRTIAMVVLPGAFREVLEQDKLAQAQANGYAALREIDRMINAYDTVAIEWEPGKPVRLTNAVADNVYLIDGSRDIGGARQLEGYTPPEEAFAVALADAVYTHLVPGIGSVLARDYPNLLPELVKGEANRYSTFGTYTVEYGWEPLMRSFAARSGSELVNALLADSVVDARGLAQDFLTGQKADMFVSDGQAADLPPLLSDVLALDQASTGSLTPVPTWLLPREDKAPFPDVPTLRDLFPDLKLIRTAYSNDQVVEEAEAELEGFWGKTSGMWADDEPRFHHCANYNAEQLERRWNLSLHIATAAVANLNDGIGGVVGALGFVDAVDRALERYGTFLDKIVGPDLQSLEEAVQHAKDEMQDRNRLDDAKEQRDYLEAAQELVQAQVTDECLRRAKALIGRFRHFTGLMRSELTGWQTQLSDMAVELERRRIAVDEERVAANNPPLRRMVPAPGDAAEAKLYSEAAGAVELPNPLPSGLMGALRQRQWRVYGRPNRAVQIVWSRDLGLTDQPVVQQDELPTLVVEHVLDLTAPLFAGLRTRNVFEVLELAGVSADALAKDVQQESARLAAFNMTGQLKVTGDNVGVQDWNYVFAAWPGTDAGSKLAADVRSVLSGVGLTCQDVPASAAGLPVTDKIVAFTARHLIAMDAFSGVGTMQDAYLSRRETVPSPHVLMEERGAARIEAVGQRLASQEGLLVDPPTRLSAAEVALCRDPLFLQYVAAALAAGKLSWTETDPIKRTGSWVLQHEGKDLPLGTETDFGALLRRISIGGDKAARDARDDFERAGVAVATASDAKEKIGKFAQATSSDLPIEEGVLAVLRVAAAQFLEGRP